MECHRAVHPLENKTVSWSVKGTGEKQTHTESEVSKSASFLKRSQLTQPAAEHPGTNEQKSREWASHLKDKMSAEGRMHIFLKM